MPKRGKGDSQWKKDIQYYVANGKFGPGVRRPAKNTNWGRIVSAIDSCPFSKAKGTTKDAAGRNLGCICSYHVSKKYTKQFHLYMFYQFICFSYRYQVMDKMSDQIWFLLKMFLLLSCLTRSMIKM